MDGWHDPVVDRDIPDSWDELVNDIINEDNHASKPQPEVTQIPKVAFLRKQASNTSATLESNVQSGVSSIDLHSLNCQREKDYEQFKAKLFQDIDRKKSKKVNKGGPRKSNTSAKNTEYSRDSVVFSIPKSNDTTFVRQCSANNIKSSSSGSNRKYDPDFDRDLSRYARRYDPGFGDKYANNSGWVQPQRTYATEFPSLAEAAKVTDKEEN